VKTLIIRLFLLLLLLSRCLPAIGQGYTQTIRGTVVDKESQQPIVGAMVILLNSTPVKGTTTDEKGRFKLSEVPIGRQSVKVIFMGYNNVTIPDLQVVSGKETVLNIEMVEAIVNQQEVVITGGKTKDKPNNDMAIVSARMFTVDETQRYAGSLGDPARMAANYAGVSGANDARNDIVIRGNSPAGLLWRLEGVDIPNPNHFANQGTTGGPVSILNNNVLANSDFFTGAWPAEYGNSISGVFDLKLRNGNNEKYEYTGQIGFNGIEAMAEGPLSKTTGASFLASYRYSVLGLFQAIGINLGPAGVPRYQDLSFKINLPTAKKGTFEVFGVGGISDISIINSNESSQNFSYGVSQKNIHFGSDMGVFGVSHTLPAGKSGYFKNILSVTTQGVKNHVDSIADDNVAYPYYKELARYNHVTLHSLYNQKINATNTFKVGVILTGMQFADSQIVFSDWTKQWRNISAANGSTFLGQAYAELKHDFSDRITALAGIQYEQLFLNNSYSIEPRGGVRYRLDNKSSIGFGYGLHGQMQPLNVYFSQTQIAGTGNYYETNTQLGFTKSQQFVLGYDRLLAKDFRLKIEAYYQQLYNVPVERRPSSFSVLNIGASYIDPVVDSLVNKGSGTNYGIEFTLEKFFSHNYYFLVTTSVFDSKYRGSDHVLRNTAFNGRYIANALAGKEFPLDKDAHHTVYANVKFTYAGGRYYSPINLIASQRVGIYIPQDSKAFTLQYPDYMKMDIRVGYKTNSRKITQEWALDIINVTNRQNILDYVYDAKANEVRKEYQLGIFPMILYRIQF
jgi:hypothetical protein